jgi:hypothetical protein
VANDVKRAAAFCALFTAVLLTQDSTVLADGQWSARLGSGAGLRTDSAANAREGVFELKLAADLLFGGPRPNVARVGPLVDLRTGDFRSAEAAGGISLSLPLFQGFPLSISAGLGYANRRAETDSAFALGRVTFGYHPYNYFNAYAYALDFYIDTRIDLRREGVWQLTAGLEIDLEFVIVVPVMFVVRSITEGDPDEPD